MYLTILTVLYLIKVSLIFQNIGLSSVLDLGRIDLELLKTATKKDNARGKYKRYRDKQRYQMGKYASETGTSAAVRKFRPDFPKINESTIREFKKKYEEELKLAKQQN